MIFNQQGLLDIDRMLADVPSFQQIMADRVVTDDELHRQSDKVIGLLHQVEDRFNDEDKSLIMQLFAEANVLSAIYRYYELQNLK